MISLGWIIGTVVAALFALGGLALIPVGRRWLRNNGSGDFVDDMPGWAGVIGGAVITVAAVLIYIGGTWPPFVMEYHTWQPVSGVVESVDKRLLADGGGGMSEKYVIAFRDNPQQYGCEDTRCALIQPGERVELSCMKVWIYAASDGYDCRFVRAGGRS